MAKKLNDARENRIEMEIMEGASGPEERAMGWYCYLKNHLQFPFTAHCTVGRSLSPLKKGDEVEVLGMARPTLCEYDMFAMVRWEMKEGLAVPLAQLMADRDVDEATRLAVEDWLYWVQMGYEF